MDYTLPQATHDAIFDSILSRYLGKSLPQEKPGAIITGGQPGSGKSIITHDAAVEFSKRGGYVIIDADKLRRFHPSYNDLLRKDDTSAADLTHPDASGWARKLRLAAQEGKRNLIIDQTSKDPAVLERLSNQLRSDGYTVELRVMAVNELISEQRIYARYEGQKAADGYGRFSTKESHDKAYRELPNSVGLVEANKSLNNIKIYNKDHQVIFSNTLINGEWMKPPTAKAVLVQERDRTLSSAEYKEYREGYEKILDMLIKRGADGNSISYINRMLKDAVHTESQGRVGVASKIADDFINLSPKEALKHHPELKDAYKILALVENKAKSDGHSKETVSAIIQQAKVELSESLKNGEVPVAKAQNQSHEKSDEERGR